MAAWQGSEWVLFLAVGLVVYFIFSSYAAVKLHFFLKQRKSQRSYTAARRATMCPELAAQDLASVKLTLSQPSVEDV